MTTMDTDLRAQAIVAVTAATCGQPITVWNRTEIRLNAAAAVRNTTGCTLREAVTAVDWAITAHNNH